MTGSDLDGAAASLLRVRGEQLLVVSNRGPVEFVLDDDGKLTEHRGAGGLVSALAALTPRLDTATWICAPRTEGDRRFARALHATTTVGGPPTRMRIKMLPVEEEEFSQYYSVVANPILWFVQHGLWDLSNAPNITTAERAAFERGYRPVNQRFADAIVDAVESWNGPSQVMIQDYHLYLVAGMVRQRCRQADLSHFVHIPWPQPDGWRVLPSWLREPVFMGLLGNDIVTFQTDRDADHFVEGCHELLGLPTSSADRTVQFGGREVRVRSHPISVDPALLAVLASTDEVVGLRRELGNARREHLILRVDRMDVSKNILRGFLAYDRLLEKHPDLAGRVTFLALLQPSRHDVAEYAEYADRILRVVADVNLKHGNVDWQPIDLRVGENLSLALAAYDTFDVLFVNAVCDGMNLVAKEGMVLNRRNGVLVLSEHTGAHDEIGRFAVSVHPVDIEAQADALYEGLFMDDVERRDRHDACVEAIRRADLSAWFDSQLRDLKGLTSPARRKFLDPAEPATPQAAQPAKPSLSVMTA
jgi:trehalose 6-phosphate synthase